MTLKELLIQETDALKKYGENYTLIAAHLNAQTSVENPRAGEIDVNTTTTTTPITLNDVLAIVPTNETAIIYVKAPHIISSMQEAIDAGNYTWLAYLLETATSPAVAALSQGTVNALTELLQSDRTVTTTTEYAQPTTIAGPSLAAAAGLGRITAAQVQAALNA